MKISEEEKYRIAKERVNKLKGFYWHLAIYIVINSYILTNIYISKGYTGEGFWHWTSFITLFFWGIGLLFHAWGVFGPRFLFSKKWEEKQIEKYLAKEDAERKQWE
ncbi:2TM domain-containing protein [Joostella atrarenae]|uniref:2TM domain-containing protein n=1 Tax=Joostella atrarenae TaxID=679257 RepID=A0ABS9J433_9FLAO|nr:2TM domain-containing protein [Joostella atrarenae]MCF8715175.1 2TM domain-containing protein [Joostella atrarenae]